MEITDEQRKRAEMNRLAALAKRKALSEASNQERQKEPWKLFKCRKLLTEPSAATEPRLPKCRPNYIDLGLNTHSPRRFRARLEICSPDSFSVAPEVEQGFEYPGDKECFRSLNECLSNVMPSHYTQNNDGGKACVYKLSDYNAVLKCLKSSKDIEVEEIPWATFNVVEKLSHSFVAGRWIPCRPEHLSDDKVDELVGKLPKSLLDILLPFQLDGLRFGLRRGGRCLIADEMGLGKTLQAIAIAGCLMNEGPILVVCPAILRFSWAEELEHWLPFCLPADIHLVFGHRDNPSYLSRFPKVVVISYTMLHRLRKSMLDQEWNLLIVDESHHVRCTKKKSEPEEIRAVLDMATKVKRVVLLSGTPSLSRPYDIFHQIDMLWPGLLGETKYKFAETYCAVESIRTAQGKTFQDFSKGIRLEELNVLLKQTVMIRRLKEHVLLQLPPKRRQIIRLLVKKSETVAAKNAVKEMNDGHNERSANREILDEPDDSGHCRIGQLSHQELGIAKLSGFREWFSIHPLSAELDGAVDLDLKSNSQKMIIFAHHHKVLDGVQEIMCEKGVGFVRIDGNTLARDRQLAVQSFRSSAEVKVAIIGITAGGVGLDFSAAQNVVFLELPQSPSLMLQAEDRAHRRGQTKAVNIYIFCAKDTLDESHWQSLNKSLHRVSSTTNGKYGAIQEIEVEDVSYLETSDKIERIPEDQFLDVAACGEQEVMKMQDCDVVKDMNLVEAHDKSAPTTNYLSSTQTINHCIKDDMVAVQIEKDVFLDGKLKENISEVDNKCSQRVPSPRLDKEYNQAGKVHKFYNQTEETDDGGLVLPVETDGSLSNHIDSLRFEVSQYTGRIHLYARIPGTDFRPRPLFVNFRPEELELLDCTASNDSERTTFNFLKNTLISRNALLAFNNEWNKLRPIEQKKLLGKPLQLPLDVELCYLRESINHNADGVLKGKSKRRSTPLYEISQPLPVDAVWKAIGLCSSSGKKKEYVQGWSFTDKPLCKLCQTPCEGNNSKTPQFFEDLFCNLGCYEEYRIRTSNRFLRQELFRIEHGVCSNCHLDCHKLVRHIRPLSLAMRREYIEKVAPNIASSKNLIKKLVNNPAEGNAWHADHIVPVYQGGGECRLENMRTLCVACHSDVSTAQCAERRSTRLKAKKQLKVIMNDLKKGQKVKKKDANTEDPVQCDTQEIILGDDLLVKVPGSAYSGGNGLAIGGEDLEEPS